jgi:hypothetical protein
MPKLPDPRDFTITDPFGRLLRFYLKDGKYCRIELDIATFIASEGAPKVVSKMVYAMVYLDACLQESEGD